MCSLPEIEKRLRDANDELRNDISRSIASSTVALFALFKSNDRGEELKLAGTGTLVVIDGVYYILTAAHVWEEVAKLAVKVGITLTDSIDHQYFMEVAELEPTGLPIPDTWTEWGPDLLLLRIPSARVGAIKAFHGTERHRLKRIIWKPGC